MGVISTLNLSGMTRNLNITYKVHEVCKMESDMTLDIKGTPRSDLQVYSSCLITPADTKQSNTEQPTEAEDETKRKTKTILITKLVFLPKGPEEGSLTKTGTFWTNVHFTLSKHTDTLWVPLYPFITAKLVVMRHTGSCPRLPAYLSQDSPLCLEVLKQPHPIPLSAASGQ